MDESTATQPILETRRLRLRPLAPADAPSVQTAAASPELSDTMISLPHPYPPGEAMRYIARLAAERGAGRCLGFALERRRGASFCGVIEVRDIDREHRLAELSFWLSRGAWGKGYMSEAVGRVVDHLFGELGLNRLYGFHMMRNPASGRIFGKNGFTQEGLLRERVRKHGRYEDVAVWALLRRDWKSLCAGESELRGRESGEPCDA